MTHKTPTPGDQFHFLRTGMTFSSGEPGRSGSLVSRRGMTVTVTQKLIDSTTDRTNTTWLSLLHDQQGQLARWGELTIAPGPAPETLTSWTPGTVEHEQVREAARAVAAAIVDPNEQARALAAVTAKYGRAASTQQSSELWGGRFQ